jgi:DNA-binding NtrC family response regulator
LHNLEADMNAGRFREDLYYRLSQVRITLPPLRERRADIPELVEAFFTRLRNKRAFRRVDPESLARLAEHHAWRGNVRELANAVEVALALDDGGRIDLGERVRDDHGSVRAKSAPSGQSGAPRPFAEVRSNLIAAAERDYFGSLLRTYAGNRSAMSRHSGYSRAQINEIVRRHRLEDEPTRAMRDRGRR